MKIYFDKIPLNEGGQPPKTMSINGKNLTSCDFAINADSALIRQNKNTNFSITVEIEREHDSENDAVIFAATHHIQLNCKTSATLEFYDDTENDKPAFFIAQNTVLGNVSTSVHACASTSKYNFIGTII